MTVSATANHRKRKPQHQEIIRLLEAYGAESNDVTNFLYAAQMGNLQCVKELLGKGVDVNAKDECLRHVLPQAFMSGNYELIDLLYEQGADPNQSHGWEDYIWLEWHVRKGDEKAVRYAAFPTQLDFADLSSYYREDATVNDRLSIDRSILWAPKIRPEKIRRLYEIYAARGLVDEKLIDEVGYSLYARCQAIWCATERRCPECTSELTTGKVDKYSVYQCVNCGWIVRKRRFHTSYKRRRLIGGSAYPAFQRFLKDFEEAKGPHQKMLAIDRLIHAFHGDLKARLRRTACSSIIEGTEEELLKMLDELAYGVADPSMIAVRDIWREKVIEAKEAKKDIMQLKR